MEQVLLDDQPWIYATVEDVAIRFCFDVAPRGSRAFAIIYCNEFGLSNPNPRFQWALKVFLRRRLSEIRDIYLSKNPKLLSIAQSLYRGLCSGSSQSSGQRGA